MFANLSTTDCFMGLVVTVVALILLFKAFTAARTSQNGIPLPPGPPARWFWDEALPSVNVARTLADLIAEYGSVVTLRRGSNVTIIVGSVDAAAEIMEKAGSALADRPRSIVVGELVYNGLSFLLMRSGERLRRFRRAAHTHLQPKAVKAYRDMQLENAKNVIIDILNDPKSHRAHVQRYAASVILRLTYGQSAPTSNDNPEIARIHQVMRNFEHAMRPGAYFAERIPWLKYIPGYGRELKEYHRFEKQLYRYQMDRVRSEMETNGGCHSFVRRLLEHPDEHNLSIDEMAYLAGNLFSAASETTAVAITNMILAAACHPEAQGRVQEELDEVVGRNRLPTWEDYDLLPQLQAYVLETLRWRPITPIGFAHRATQDIVWRGRYIPTGSTVIGCHWAISRDHTVFPDPEKFDPQRWINEDGGLRNLSSYPYGFGRRVCPGRYLANKSLYINLALLLWSFHIAEKPDAPIDADDYTDTVVAQAAPFDVEFRPRVEEERLKEMMSKLVI